MKTPYSAREWLQLSMQQQGLLQKTWSTPDAVDNLSYVQIDSINVVERSHHHVLHNRIADYSPELLELALEQKSIFEYWSHAAAYLPMRDYRFSLYRKKQLQEGETHWHTPQIKEMQAVKQRITCEGPLKANQFAQKTNTKTTGWWDWKPAKKALEQLFIQGELMVLKREKFQKVYDLTERVLPSYVDTTLPSKTEFAKHLISRYLNAHGFGNSQQISYLRKGLKSLITDTLEHMCENGELSHFTQLKHSYYYLPRLTLPTSVPNKVYLLNPFDNLVIQRQKLKTWFNFDYQIEVYVPELKRKYGYYSLLILWKDRFIGRVDVKADRKNKCLLLQQLSFEDNAFNGQPNETNDRDAFTAVFMDAVFAYMKFNNCEHWQLIKCNDAKISALLDPLLLI